MKKQVLAIALLVVLVGLAGMWVFRDNWLPTPKAGFSLVRLSDNLVVLSDADALVFNSTSQEIALSDSGSQRLKEFGFALYSFGNDVSIRVNGEEIYQGVFRLAIMSAVPSPPKIAILFPSMQFPSGVENDHALRLFYPGFQPPGDITETYLKLTQYFQETNRLVS